MDVFIDVFIHVFMDVFIDVIIQIFIHVFIFLKIQLFFNVFIWALQIWGYIKMFRNIIKVEQNQCQIS